MLPEPPDFSHLLLVAEHERGGTPRSRLARDVDVGRLDRLRRGILAVPGPASPDRSEPSAARRRYLDRILSVAMTREAPPVFFGASAAAIWDLPSFGAWPDAVHLLASTDAAIRSGAGVTVHRVPHREDEVVAWGPFAVTSPARTIVDLARSGDVMNAVLALDGCLGAARARGIQVTKEECVALVDRLPGRWGKRRTLAVIGFADGRAANGGESASRVLIHRLGFPRPELQVSHAVQGKVYIGDFEWRRPDGTTLIGEFDGLQKYIAPQYGRDRSAERIFMAEKRREDELRAAGFAIVRWGHLELRDPERLRHRLVRAGLTPFLPRNL